MHTAADALAVEQDASDGIQGDRVGRRQRRHHRHAARRQRRELLRRVEELHVRHEEPGGQVQRPQIRRQIRKR